MSRQSEKKVLWIGWVRDLWVAPPWRWLKAENIETETELGCLDALCQAYPERGKAWKDRDGYEHPAPKRFDLVAIPVGQTPTKGPLLL